MRESFIYFAQARHVPFSPIKIGRSNNPNARVAELQTGNWEEPMVIATVRCWAAPELERRLHAEFADDRLAGEWFRFSARLWDRIVQLGDEFQPQEASA